MRILYLFFAISLLLAACKNEPAPPSHESALPHNNMAQGSDSLTVRETQQLAHAQGKTAKPVSAEALLAQLRQDTTPLVVLNFWKKDCAACLELQQMLQKMQMQSPGKFKILAISLDGSAATEEVNLQFRSAGVTSETLLLSPAGSAETVKLHPGWNGGTPALMLQTADGLRQFFQQNFSENELMAMLQPLML